MRFRLKVLVKRGSGIFASTYLIRQLNGVRPVSRTHVGVRGNMFRKRPGNLHSVGHFLDVAEERPIRICHADLDNVVGIRQA